jgi:hypothetical protein
MEYKYYTKAFFCSGMVSPKPEDDESAAYKSLIASIKLATEEMNEAVAMNQLKDSILQATKDMKAGFDPAEPRIPQGNSGGGRWSKPGGGSGSSGAGTSPTSPSGADTRKPSVWQELFGVKPAHAEDITGGDGTGRPRTRPRNPMDPVAGPIASGRGDAAGMTAAEAEVEAIRQTDAARLIPLGMPKDKLTNHGGIRVGERVVNQNDIAEAIQTARKNGNITSKIGKYGTLQYHYRGSNGLTVIIETQGRNAGKVITVYGKKSGGKL